MKYISQVTSIDRVKKYFRDAAYIYAFRNFL